MTARAFTEEENRILNEVLRTDKRDTSKQSTKDEQRIAELAKLRARSPLQYDKRRKETADEFGVRVSALDDAVRKQQAHSHDEASALPHWEVEPWPDAVPGAELLVGVRGEFERYIVLPPGAADALSLWVLHAWTIDAGDISPFLVLASPTKRCGKTSVLIVLCYLTPRSELASNISASALFRYVEEVRPTLLIDEADSFLKADEAMRGILNSGHTRAAAYVIRNVEANGDHKPKRFSTWTPKAIAAIGELADTLQDRAVILQLQRKPKTAKVARLRKRDCGEFALLRRKAARWAADNFDKLRDPDPEIPAMLDDRAADNWRPLLAIADLAGEAWPRRAREAACLLSGEGHEATSISVELLADIQRAFGDEPALRSVDLVARLTADPERPWVEWKNGKPLTQRLLAGLLGPFGIISETVHIAGLKDAMGYKRVRFEEPWGAYLPGQNALRGQTSPSEVPKYPSADEAGISDDFGSTLERSQGTSKNDDLSYSDAGLGTWVDKKAATGRQGEFDQAEAGPSHDPEPGDDTFGAVPNTGSDNAETEQAEFGSIPKGTRAQVELPAVSGDLTIPDDLSIPLHLRRQPEPLPEPRKDGKRAGTYLSDDDIAFIESGKFK
jgi:putative DNA primase/helicase